MTLSPESETSPAAPTEQTTPPPAEGKSRKASRRPSGLFSGPAADDQQPHDQPRPPSPNQPPADDLSASGSPDAAASKKTRRGRAAPSSTPSITDRKQIKAAIGAGVELVGVNLHLAAAARDENAAETGVWLADEQDKEGISEPLSSLVARRGGPGVVNPDLGDAIAALIALVAYVSKNLDIAARVRSWRKRKPTDQAATMTEQATPQEPAA